MAQRRFLYSTNSRLAYGINQRYYGGRHYVYCSHYFSASSLPARDRWNPVTSSPAALYRRYMSEIGDRHSPTILANKVGLRRGALARRSQGIISDDQEVEINEIISASETRDFAPMIYVIRYEDVAGMIEAVPVGQRAHPLSEEYVIQNLKRELFDVLEFD
jgi:hypothetical protein